VTAIFDILEQFVQESRSTQVHDAVIPIVSVFVTTQNAVIDAVLRKSEFCDLAMTWHRQIVGIGVANRLARLVNAGRLSALAPLADLLQNGRDVTSVQSPQMQSLLMSVLRPATASANVAPRTSSPSASTSTTSQNPTPNTSTSTTTSVEAREALLARGVALANGLVCAHEHASTDADALEQLTRAVCAVADDARGAALLGACLQHFEAFVGAGVPAPGAVRHVLASLCRLINVDRHARASWDVVRALLLTPYYARIGLRALCALLVEPGKTGAPHVQRGAVYCIGMACWGAQCVPACRSNIAAVMGPFVRCVVGAVVARAVIARASALSAHTHSIVAYEIALALGRLVRKYAASLSSEWEEVLDILIRLVPVSWRVVVMLTCDCASCQYAVAAVKSTNAFVELLLDILVNVDSLRLQVSMCAHARACLCVCICVTHTEP
jgi:hypothetical protein